MPNDSDSKAKQVPVLSLSNKKKTKSMNHWNRFWKWYETKILGSVVIIAIIQFIQVPHMLWNADLYLELGIVSRVHPALDWLLYGVDLIEIVSIINVGMIMFSLIRNRRSQNEQRLTKTAI